MKRLIALVCLLLTLTVSASAEWELPVVDEDFSIRNGISFGMTKDEVLAVEKANGHVPDSNEENNITFREMPFLGGNAWLKHCFTKGDKLSSFAYTRMGDSHKFADIYEALNEKYSKPMLTTELPIFSTAIWLDVPFNMFNHSSKWSANTLSGGAAGSTSDGTIWISNYAVWLVKHKDCAIVIELAEATTSRRDKYLSLGYASITYEQMEMWLNLREAENQATKNSYANDI